MAKKAARKNQNLPERPDSGVILSSDPAGESQQAGRRSQRGSAAQREAMQDVSGGEFRMMPRSMLHGAPYNPRQIDQYAARGLRENLRRVKLVQPVVWNQRTGNIVAGHQRMSQCDVLMNGQDYLVPTFVVDWDLKTEKEQNVALNSQNIQGSWDIDKLDALVREPEFSIENAGFDLVSLEQVYFDANRDMPDLSEIVDLGPDQPDGEEDGSDELEAIAAESESLKRESMAEEAAQMEKDKIAEIKKAKRKFKERAAWQQEAAFYFVMAFPTNESCAEFLKKSGVDPIHEVQYGPRIAENLGIRLESLVSQEQVSENQDSSPESQPEGPEDEQHISDAGPGD